MAYIQLYYEIDSKGDTTASAEYSVILETNKNKLKLVFADFPDDTKPSKQVKGTKPKNKKVVWTGSIDPISLDEIVSDYFVEETKSKGGIVGIVNPPKNYKEKEILALLYSLGVTEILANVIEV